MKDCCFNCKWSKDWCCGKKKREGYITCLQPELLKNNGDKLIEIDGNSKCNKYDKLNA